MIRRSILACAASSALIVACSSGTNPRSGSSSSGASGTGPSASGPTGEVGGQPFTFKSGYFTINDGTHDTGAKGLIDVVLSTADAVCDAAMQQKLHGGETLVQLYGLEGTAPGAYVAVHDEIKYGRIKPTCPSGAPLEANADSAGRIQSSAVTLSRVDAALVEGTIDLTFDDGSKLAGSFSVPSCTLHGDFKVCF